MRKTVAVCLALMLGLYGGHAVLGAQPTHGMWRMASSQPDGACFPAGAVLLPPQGSMPARPVACGLSDEAASQDALVDALGAADRFE